jgi:hypothetical protein
MRSLGPKRRLLLSALRDVSDRVTPNLAVQWTPHRMSRLGTLRFASVPLTLFR